MSLVKAILLISVIYKPMTCGIDGFDNKRHGFFALVEGKVLKGSVIERWTVDSPLQCSRCCLRNVLCSSFNYKLSASGSRDACELNNATRLTSPKLYQDGPLYDHYFDPRYENFKSCLDYLRNGARDDGIYTITDASGDTYKIFCDLTSEPGSAWTLILSFAFKSRYMKYFCSKGINLNEPYQMDNPNWEAYRLSLSRMNLLSSQSTHVRITTSFAVYGVDFRDYFRTKITDLNILVPVNYGWGACRKVEYVDIRGNKGQDQTILLYQADKFFLHADSQTSRLKGCQYDGSAGAVTSENNFGRYCTTEVNRNFRGCANDDSTTEYWFGGYL